MTARSVSSSVSTHHREAARVVACAVVTVSDTRTLETDRSGSLAAEMLAARGHHVLERRLVADDVAAIRAVVEELLGQPELGAVILTGGSGIAPRDVTPEAVRPLLEREIPGFGELFRMLSFEEVGPAALLSRALAGTARGRLVAALPGSEAAVRLALERLLLPELGHLVAEARKQ